MDYPLLHHLLRYDLEHSERAPIDWDLHDAPSSACYCVPSIVSGATLLEKDLSMSATALPVNSLRIICDVLPCSWPMVARNTDGVTVKDVLLAIHDAVQRQITMYEWSNLTDKQRDKVTKVFSARWQRCANPSLAHATGVLRIDTLLHHTVFAGLTPIAATEPTCVLTLAIGRRSQQSPTSTAHDE